MSATLLSAIASGAAATLTAAIDGLKVYTYEPRDFEPASLDTTTGAVAVTILGPVTIERRAPEDGDSQLGSFDWLTRWLLRLYVQLDDPETAQTDMRSVVGQIIAAVDAAPTLGLVSTLDAVVEEVGEPEFTENPEGRQFARYPITLAVWSLV